VPDVVAELVTCVLPHSVPHLRAKHVVVAFGARDADHGKARRQQPPHHQRIQRRHQLLVREVAGGAEDHEHTRIRRPPKRQAFLEWILRQRDRRSSAPSALASALIACPPNWLRRAAATFAAKLISSRDAKRAKRAAEMTGAGTFSAIASWIVQRPSPESSTYGAMSSSLLPCSSKALCSSSSSHERTTEPYRQMPDSSCRSTSNSECSMISNPSAYACMIP